MEYVNVMFLKCKHLVKISTHFLRKTSPMKYRIKSSDVANFEKIWNELKLVEFHLLTREINFVNETVTISIPKEYVERVTW